MLRPLLIATLLAPAQALALNIIEVMQLAEQRDAVFQTAQADFRATLAGGDISQGDLYPQVNFSAFASETRSTTTNSSSTSSPNGDSDFGARGYSLTLSQTLYDKSLLDAADADAARIEQARAELEDARQQLILRVAENYFELAAAQDGVRLAIAEKTAIARQLEQANERLKAGLTTSIDVREAQAQYDLSVANTFVAASALDNGRESLRLLIDQVFNNIGELSTEMPLLDPEPDDIDAWQQTALDTNHAMRASRFALRVAELEHDSASGEHYPTLSLNAEHNFTSSDGSTVSNAFSGRDLDENRISLNLNVPIYLGGTTSASVQQQLAELDSARADVRHQQRLTVRAVRSAFLNVKASISRVKALRQALASTQLATEATRLSFEVGKRNSVDVLLAQREQYASENQYRRARYNYLLNTLRLKHAAGQLSTEDLSDINRFIVDRN